MGNNKFMIGDRYQINAIIGQGGMADVYLANDIILNREVAVKILRDNLAEDPVYVKRFKREANAVATLSNPNIVEIYDVGEEKNRYYIVMEYVAGQTLKELTYKRGALHVSEAIDIMKQVVNGVKAAHECGIIHRDLKPQNILVTNGGIAKIADFGIASISSAVQVTKTDTIMGSLHYLAPELARGQKATPQSDIYALGIIFYELLVGQVPFNGDAPVNIALKHMQEEIPSVRDVNPTIYQSVENIIIKATAKNLDNRYSNVEEMYNDLEKALENKDAPKLVFDVPQTGDTTIIASNDDLFDEQMNNGENKEEDKEKEKKKKRMKIALYSAMSVASVAIIMILLFATGVFSKKIKQVEIPQSIIGMEYEDAVNELKKLDLEINDMVLYKTSDKYKKNEVMAINPSTGTKVNVHSSIQLTVSKGPEIVIENYVGKNINDVKNELENLGLVVSVNYTTNDQPKNTIIYQSISEGTVIDPASATKSIQFEVSSGYKVEVKNVINMQVANAKKILEDQGFVVEYNILPSPTDPTEIKTMSINTVVKQSIEPYTEVTEKGKKIVLSYYDHKPEIPVEKPTQPPLDSTTQRPNDTN